MPELHFQIDGIEAVQHSAAPLLVAKLRITNLPAEQAIHSATLRCQVQIEPAKRRYQPQEQEKLHDLFGEPARWGRTVKPMHWMNATVGVPGFSGETTVNVELPCTFDFNVAATKYFAALEDGDIALCFLFSGTVFYHNEDGAVQITQVPWDREANFRLPAATWRQMMDMHYPNAAWLCLHRDAFALLSSYKMRHGIPTFEQAVERLVSHAIAVEAAAPELDALEEDAPPAPKPTETVQ